MDLVLVDDHPAVRAGLRGLLEDEDDLRVAATAATAREGFEAIADLQPALALLDLHLPDDDGLSLCLRTRALPAPPRVVVYSAFADARSPCGPRSPARARWWPRRRRRGRLLAVLRAVGAGGAARRSSAGPCARPANGSTTDDLPILGMLAHGVGRGGDRRDARAGAGVAGGPALGDARPRLTGAARRRSPVAAPAA